MLLKANAMFCLLFPLTRGCGHPKLISDLQEQGTVHREEAVTVKR